MPRRPSPLALLALTAAAGLASALSAPASPTPSGRSAPRGSSSGSSSGSSLGSPLGSLLGGRARRQAPVEDARPRLTVVTYNVNFGLAGDRETIAVIADAGADLVLLQETNAGWERRLRATLGDRYPHMAFRHQPAAGGLAILSRFPFEERDYIPAPSGWFPAWRVLVASPLGPLQVLNVHLRPPLGGERGAVRAYLETPAVRRDEIEAYHAYLEPGIAALVAGDFNENETGLAVRFLASRGMTSALPGFQRHATTWRWDTRMGTLRARFDHLVHDARLEALDVAVLDGGRSDHLAVLGVFTTPARVPPSPGR